MTQAASETQARTAAWHRTMFDEFTRNELAVGGPDVHMRYVGYCVFPHGWQEIVWRLGVYVSVYNFATAEVIWQHWSAERIAREEHELYPWLKAHWEGLRLHRHRRAVRSPEKLAQCLETYAEWAREALPVVLRSMTHDPKQNYEILWREANRSLYGFGRYATFKLLEAYRRYADVHAEMPDIRPRGGFNPRTTLNMLDGDGPDPHDDTAATLAVVNEQAARARHAQAERTGLGLDQFRFEVMLCEYRQSSKGNQYPGRSLDSEVKYYDTILAYWGESRPTQFWEARRAVTHARGHGEERGWHGTRDDLGVVLMQEGFTWSDLIYDYPIRRGLRNEPLRWDGALSEHQMRLMAQETLESRW